MSATPPTLDEFKLNAFVGRMLGDLGALTNAVLVHVGDRLGLYKALVESGPTTPQALAQQTGTSARLVREWLSAQSAQGYVTYDRDTQKFSLSPEQAMVFADEDSPVFMAGFFDVATGLFHDTPKIVQAFKSGRGLAWHEHNGCLFCGTERFFRPSYNHHLVNEWLPALDGVVAKLQNGAQRRRCRLRPRRLDHPDGAGVSQRKFSGFDYHPGSIETARTGGERSRRRRPHHL